MAVRYAIIGVLFGSVILFFLFSYLHARRRLKKGLHPLRYHNWMVRRRQRQYQQSPYRHGQAYYSPYTQPSNPRYSTGYGGGAWGEQNPDSQSFAMRDYPPAPPAYGAWESTGMPPPPSYQPPAGASKVSGNQVYVSEAGTEGNGEGAAGPVAPPQPAAAGPRT